MGFQEFVMLQEKKDNNWRCPVCGRLLGYINKEGFLELETKNRQFVIVDYLKKEGVCKCGVKIVCSGMTTSLVFNRRHLTTFSKS